MNVTRAIAGAAAAVMTMIALASPAANASEAEPPRPAATVDATTTCGERFSAYSQDRWTYTEARFCLATDGSQVWPVLEYSECQYYWGGAWYYANAKYQCAFDFSYTVTRNGQDLLTGSSTGSGGREGTVQGTATGCAGPGAYTLKARYVLDGPYWTDWRIDSGERTYNLEVPCS